MIKDFEFYHGAALSRLIHASQSISVKLYSTETNASYVINDRIGLYIKHSSKRMSPWRFSFHKVHQNEILRMKNDLDDVFLVLVCYDDGVVVLSFDELRNLLDEVYEEVEWISVSRNPREKYAVKGSDGKLRYKIGENEFPRKILGVKSAQNKNIFSWFK